MSICGASVPFAAMLGCASSPFPTSQPSCRYLEADGRLIWVTSGVRLSTSARPGPDGAFADDKLIELLKKPLSYFNLSKAERALASGSEKITPPSRHRAVGAPNPVDAALDRVATDMHKPVNAGIRALVLKPRLSLLDSEVQRL